jgi:hypothetical protein
MADLTLSVCVTDSPHAGNVIKHVQARNASCWDGCAKPTNSSSTCWIDCLFDTLGGDLGDAGRPGMTREEIVLPFERSFATGSVAEGGCPDWTPPNTAAAA